MFNPQTNWPEFAAWLLKVQNNGCVKARYDALVRETNQGLVPEPRYDDVYKEAMNDIDRKS